MYEYTIKREGEWKFIDYSVASESLCEIVHSLISNWIVAQCKILKCSLILQSAGEILDHSDANLIVLRARLNECLFENLNCEEVVLVQKYVSPYCLLWDVQIVLFLHLRLHSGQGKLFRVSELMYQTRGEKDSWMHETVSRYFWRGHQQELLLLYFQSGFW